MSYIKKTSSIVGLPVNSSHGHLVTRSNCHTVISAQASIVQSHGWAMLNYAGEASEVGNGYTASFAAATIFQDTPMIRPPKLGLGAQNSVGMQILSANVQNLCAPDT